MAISVLISVPISILILMMIVTPIPNYMNVLEKYEPRLVLTVSGNSTIGMWNQNEPDAHIREDTAGRRRPPIGVIHPRMGAFSTR